MNKFFRAWKIYRREGFIELTLKFAGYLPTRLGMQLVRFLHFVLPEKDFVKCIPAGETWILVNSSTLDAYHFPRYPHVLQYRKVAEGYGDIMLEKYTLPGFVEVNENDNVLDAGAFVGAFSRAAASVADSVIAVEASPATYHCLKLNIEGEENITAYNLALWNKNEALELHLGIDPSDHSLIDVDGDKSGFKLEVDAMRLDDFVEKNDISEVDFLKLDAEGGEPEVLEGDGELSIKKIAVDCGPERVGESTVDKVARLLEKRGYTTQQRDYVIFASR